jgi:hypothetical protein
MKVKTSELVGIQLDWAVALAEGRNPLRCGDKVWANDGQDSADEQLEYSTDWSQGGPIIEREHMDLSYRYGGREDWSAWTDERQEEVYEGPTPLIAAMRCYVASKLGDEVEIP